MWVKQCHVYHPPVITIFIHRWCLHHAQRPMITDLTKGPMAEVARRPGAP